MKKTFLMAFAALGLVACMQEEVVTIPQTDAITFDQASIDNATRAAADPSTTTQNIAGFDVWAFMNEWDGTVLVDEDVKKAGGKWTYANTQYWTPNNKYYFAALAPMNSANVTETIASGEAAKLGLGEIAFTNVDGSEDLLYAATTVVAPDYDQLKLNNMPPVKFEFSHLLSKVKFTFTNGFTTDNAYVVIEDIKMTAPKSGTIDLAVENWWDNDQDWVLGTEEFELEFGDVAKLAMGKFDECAQERLTIPAEADQVYDITFTVKLYMGNQLALETVKTSAVTGVAFEMGKAYNLTAEINSDNLELPAIEFDVVVKEWDEPTIDVPHPVVATFENVAYTSLQDAIDAAAQGGTIYLTSKVEETVTIVEKAGVELVIDGQDNKFDGQIKIHNGSSYNDGKVTIKNVNFETNVLENNFVYAVDFGNAQRYSQNITVEDCTFTALAGSKAENTAVGVKVNASKNLVVKNCVATNMHSLLQAQSCDAAVTVEGVEITGKNGVSFGNTAFPTLKDATINATGYGVRADANANRGALVVENVTIEANRPIVVRKTSTPYSVTVNGTNNITAGDGFDVIFTKGDDEGALVAPAAANVTFNGPATLSVYPGYSDEETTYVATAAGLQEALQEVNAGTSDKDVVLVGDIDLAALMTRSVVSNWTPVGTSEKPFTGVFDGNGHTIKNLTLVEPEAKEGKAYIGFFGYAKNATIKNVTFENVHINIPCLDIDHSQGHIGAVAGSLEGTSTIENVTVKGDIQVYATQDANGASRVAVVAGGNAYGDVTMKNVHVIANEGSYLTANNNTGALAGQLQGKSVFENCSSNIDVTVNKFFAGGLIGIAPADATFTNCHTTGNVAVVAGRAGRANDHYRVGGIAGGWADGAKNVCTLNGCTYTGTLTGINADGSVATTFDYDGYVGRGYTLANCGGSKVVIDGTEYVQLNNTDYGVYVINGTTVTVGTADALVAALASEYDVLLTNDIKIEPAKMSNAYGKTGINVKYGQTIDGDGHTLNIKGAGGTWDSGINTTGGLIKNLTVTGSFRGIFINHNSDHSEKVALENVTITGTVYTLSCDQGMYQGIEATNCTFNGWTSFAKTAGEAKFINCSFGEGSGYKYCRPYSNTEFVNCTFCPGYAVDTTQATVTFTDCIWE